MSYENLQSEKRSLEYIIDNKAIETVFQPIISLRDGEILGHEALSRISCDCEIKDIEKLFKAAENCNRLWEAELLCRTKAFEAAFKFMKPPYNKKLFVNVNPNVMHDENFKKGLTKEFLMQYEISSKNIIFEITERNVIADMKGFISTIDHYKSQDYKIAIDDAGAGYSGLNLISDVSPDYIKLDMKLIRGINADSLKFALVKGMVELSKISNICIIAEGIETREEMTTLINLGIQYGQGYYIQKPAKKIFDIDSELIKKIMEINVGKNNLNNSSISNIYIENLCAKTVVISPDEKVLEVYDFFKNHEEFFGLCVVENDIPVGIVTKENLAYRLSGYYGFTLNQNKDISHIMDRDFMSVDFKMPVSIVSSMAMDRSNDKLYDFIVVTKDDKYLGTVTIKDLLKKTTEIEVAAAKHQNPLTNLPGNMIIEQKIKKCLCTNQTYSVAYFDIDNFKAFNDVYGFGNGDSAIRLLAELLKESFAENQFVGHIGGDDFIVVLDECVESDFFTEISDRFQTEAMKFYNESDRQKGYITTGNRHGIVENFPLMTVTYVVANNNNVFTRSEDEIKSFLAKKKKEAKLRLKYIRPAR